MDLDPVETVLRAAKAPGGAYDAWIGVGGNADGRGGESPRRRSGQVEPPVDVLVGGGALLRRVDELISKETGVPAYVADAPIACTALGAVRALEQYEILRRSHPDL